jgi:Uma2 family endonuclease
MPTAPNRRIVTVDEYHRMADAGILTENDRVELIDGEIVEKVTIGPRHLACVDRATQAFVTGAAWRAIVRVQGSFRLSFLSEPEPDVTLLRARPDYYVKALPTPADVLLVVEIADSWLAFDRDRKRPLYAEAGVAEFWLVDLNTNIVLRHRDPEGRAYRTVERHTRGETIAPVLLPECRIPVDVLLIE